MPCRATRALVPVEHDAAPPARGRVGRASLAPRCYLWAMRLGGWVVWPVSPCVSS